MLLVIDIGNTRTKWALADDAGKLQEAQACLNADIAASALALSAKQASKVMIANVAGEVMALQIATLLKPLDPHFIVASTQACGVTNGSSEPEKLGADRWAALLAAWHLNKHPSLVVNAGTAITMDALDSKGKFFGGTIMPGLRLMQSALASSTAQLKVVAGVAMDFPVNTQDAIESGGLNAVCGAIGLMLKRLEKHSGWLPKLILSGGDALKIADALKLSSKQVIITENLVLQGLVLLEREKV
jgi:type III pantothenate kinase